MSFRESTSMTPSATVTIAAAIVSAGVIFSWSRMRGKSNAASFPPPPASAAVSSGSESSTKKTVLVLGAGTIGSSFTSVFLAKGMQVVSFDPHATREILEKRIREYWPVLVARGLTTAKEPPFSMLQSVDKLDEKAVKNAAFVQECVWENVENKQSVLTELDALVDPSVVIASSTSFIPWTLLSEGCTHKHRIMIGHPAIPHTHSFMEIYGVSPEWAAYCSEWYAQAGFDVIVMKQTIPGHVFNSFLMINVQHGLKLVSDGVCSPQDVNTAMRHFGRDLYGRHAYLTVLTMAGGDRGLQGGLELSSRIMDDAIFLTLFSSMKRLGYPDFVARTMSKYLGRFLAKLSPPLPAEWLEECRNYEDKITKGGTVPVQTGCFQVTSEMYNRIPLEPNNDPLKLRE